MNFFTRLAGFLFVVGTLGIAQAKAEPTGGVAGRIRDAATGQYLTNARVTVEGLNRDTFTTALGEYQIADLPPGPVVLRVFYTGQQPQSATASIVAGQIATQDFALSGVFEKGPTKAGDAVVLDAFTVAAKKAESAAEIAINEQRFAANIKTVVSTAAFGDIGQDNVGEFLKFLPGVEAVYGDMNINNVQLRGMPTAGTPVSMDGASMVSSSTLATDRNVNFQAISLNNVSRIEVSKVALPDQRSDSVGGSVNMVSRSAFEHSRPELRFKFFVQMNANDASLRKTAGGNNGGDGYEYKWFPDFELNYVNPLSKTLGIAINAARNDKWVFTRRLTRSYSITNTDAAHPYLSGFTLTNYPSFETRNTGGIRVDWKFAPRDVVSVNINYSRYFSNFEQHSLAYATGTLNAAPAGGVRTAATGDFSPTFTQGRAGQGSVNQSLVTRYGTQPNAGGSVGYRHTGAQWDWDAIFSGNKSKVAYRNTSLGQFDQARANQTALTVRFDGIDTYGPIGITTLRGATPINPLDLNNAVFAPGANQTRDAAANARNFNANLKRKFALPSFYGSLKTGVAFRSDARDRQLGQYTPVYAGHDRRENSGDEVISALPAGTLKDPVFSTYGMTRGYAAPQWISARKSNSLFLAHPEYFTYTTATAAADYQAVAGAAEELQEQITAGYLMADVSLLHNRLRLAGGVRLEKTYDEGRGLLTDNSRQFRKDANGKLVDGNPALAGVQPVAITTDALEVAKLTRVPLGNHAEKAYHGYYPSLSATVTATENLLVRLGYAKTLSRPNYANILPTLSVNQITNPADNATGTGLGTITAKNPNLRPWEADGYDVSVEYYTRSGGVLSVGAFRKDITNFFTNVTTLASAQFLEEAGLSEDYLNYQINYPANSADQVRMTGLEVAAQQKLLRNLSVFANLSLNRNTGPREADFRGYVRKRVNAGFTFARNPFTLNLNFYYTPKTRAATSAIASDGWTYTAARPRIDATIDYRLTKRLTLFLWGRNIFNDRDKTLAYGSATPDYAKYSVESNYGVIFQAGVKGSW